MFLNAQRPSAGSPRPDGPGVSNSPCSGSWATPDAPPVVGWLSPTDIEAGDLIFTARPSFLQELCTRAGEPWRHVGIATPLEDGLAIAEAAGPRFSVRPIDTVIASSDAVAIGRVASARREAARAAGSWCASWSEHEQVYAWDDVILAGFIAATRRYCLPQDRAVLERAVGAATARVAERTMEAAAPSFTCSTFVVQGFRQAGHEILFDLHQPRAVATRPSLFEMARRRRRPLRSAAGSCISTYQLHTLVGALVRAVVAGSGVGVAGTPPRDLARWVTPGDLWRSSSLVERWFISSSSQID